MPSLIVVSVVWGNSIFYLSQDHITNLNNAFDTAERELGIPKLLDAEDVDRDYPDERSVITYVAEYYHKFAEMKKMGEFCLLHAGQRR